MTKRIWYKRIAIIASVALVAVFVVTALLQSHSTKSFSYRIFDSITELDALENIEGITIENWNSIDKNITGIDFVDSRNIQVKYNKSTYRVRAYVFESDEDAARYFSKFVSNFMIGFPWKTFSVSGTTRPWPFPSNKKIYYTNKVYYVEGNSGHAIHDFLDLLGQVFTQELGPFPN